MEIITLVSKRESGFTLFISRPMIIHSTVTSFAWSFTSGALVLGCSWASSIRDLVLLRTKPQLGCIEKSRESTKLCTYVSPACQKSSVSSVITSESAESIWNIAGEIYYQQDLQSQYRHDWVTRSQQPERQTIEWWQTIYLALNKRRLRG